MAFCPRPMLPPRKHGPGRPHQPPPTIAPGVSRIHQSPVHLQPPRNPSPDRLWGCGPRSIDRFPCASSIPAANCPRWLSRCRAPIGRIRRGLQGAEQTPSSSSRAAFMAVSGASRHPVAGGAGGGARPGPDPQAKLPPWVEVDETRLSLRGHQASRGRGPGPQGRTAGPAPGRSRLRPGRQVHGPGRARGAGTDDRRRPSLQAGLGGVGPGQQCAGPCSAPWDGTSGAGSGSGLVPAAGHRHASIGNAAPFPDYLVRFTSP